MTTSLMLPTRISVFILLNAFHLFNCVERSDWTYDRETGLVNTTTANGTTYSCRAWDIIDRADPLKKMLPTDGRVCLDPTQSENDTGCVRMDVLNIFSSVIEATENRSACIYPVPTDEEIFEKIEKIYRSTLDDESADDLGKWIVEVAKNITSMRVEYSENEAALEEIEYARNITLIVLYERASRLPEQREKVYRLQTKFEEAKSNLTDQRNTVRSTDALDESDITLDTRNQMLSLEITALRDSHEFEMYDWYSLAKLRVLFMKLVSLKKKMMGNALNKQEEEVVEDIRTELLTAMAESNEIVAYTEYLIREVEYRFGQARQFSEIDKDLMTEE